MPLAKILVAEDEALVAHEISLRLGKRGYDMCAVVTTGQDALEQAALHRPDLALLDIHLAGSVDGAEVAVELRQNYGIPSVFLTGYTDDQTLESARRAAPYGYLVKPFEERELYAAIETALARHDIEQALAEEQSLLASVLDAIGEGVVAADASGAVQFLNPAAEKMTGWSREQAIGCDLAVILKLIDPRTHDDADFPLLDLIQSAACRMIRRTLVSQTGSCVEVDVIASPIMAGPDIVRGLVTVLRPVHPEGLDRPLY